MISIGINPVAFSMGVFEVRWYGIMVVLAVIAVIAISILEARRVGMPTEHIYNVGLWAIIGGIVISRLFHVIDKWNYYIANPWQIIRFEGLTIYGAVIGAMIGVLIYAWVKKLSFWQIGDIAAPGALVGQAIGRVGCVLNGCCYGLPTTLPWGLIYTYPGSYGPGEAVHPTQIYHLLWNLIAFAIIWSLRTRLKPAGSVFLAYFALYAAGDLGVRFLREGEPFRSGMFFNMQQAQLIGIAILMITVPLFLIRMWRYRAKQRAIASIGGVNETEQNRGV